MAKRGLFILILAVLVAGGVFAEMSAGVGLTLGMNLAGVGEAKAGVYTEKIYPMMPSIFNIGAFGFFDATYVETSVSFFFGFGEATYVGETKDVMITNLSIGLLGKFPFDIGNGMTIFPAFGVEYQIVLGVSQDDNDFFKDIFRYNAIDMSAFWIRFGGGLDYKLGGSIFLRGTALYGIRFNNKMESDIDILWKRDIEDRDDASYNAGLKHGFVIRAAIGFSF